jgi:hypothetical protein
MVGEWPCASGDGALVLPVPESFIDQESPKDQQKQQPACTSDDHRHGGPCVNLLRWLKRHGLKTSLMLVAAAAVGWRLQQRHTLCQAAERSAKMRFIGSAAASGPAAATSPHQQSLLDPRGDRPASGNPSGAAAASEEGEEGDVRIPLRDVLRFKERQWYQEEVEACRQGDANAMLRLAKMYLHGQGCAQSPGLASAWLRKARCGELGEGSAGPLAWAELDG